MALATLSIDLEARLAKFTQDMGQAARVTEKSAAQMSSALGVVRASIGSAIAPLDGVLPQDLMDAADADMYRDKRERRRRHMHDAGDVVPAPRLRESNTAPLVREVLNGAPVTRGIPYIGEIIPPLADHQAPQRHHA